MWWIRASIQEYILRSWSLVKMGTTAAQKKLFFNLRKLKGQMQAIDDGDLSPEHVKKIADHLDVPEEEVVNMNRRMAGADHSLNAPLRADSEESGDKLVDDDQTSQEAALVESDEFAASRAAGGHGRPQRARSTSSPSRLAETHPRSKTWQRSTISRVSECGRSKSSFEKLRRRWSRWPRNSGSRQPLRRPMRRMPAISFFSPSPYPSPLAPQLSKDTRPC